MTFTTIYFALFLTAFVVLFHVARRFPARARQLVVVANIAFYATWGVAYVPLLLGSSLLAFVAARRIAAARAPVQRRRWLAVGVVGCLALLAIFKYANFALANVYAVLRAVGWSGTEYYSDLALPVGISFFTFVNVAYVVDVYRRSIGAQHAVFDCLAPLTFFPHLLSGPIVRMPQLVPQFERLAGIQASTYRFGLLLLFLGLAKKTLAGLLDPVAASVFADPPSSLAAWTSVLAYAAQIYADFCGYTDMALGAALLIGIELPHNFELPYVAISPTDFWRRWHKTLSSWIHDYVFMPLARYSRRTYASLLITWLLVGVWHGPQWTFVAYGLYHGLAIIATRFISTRAPDAWHDQAARWPLATLCRAITFLIVAISFILFRAPDLGAAAGLARSLFVADAESVFSYAACLTLGLVAVALVVPHLVDAVIWKRRDAVQRGLVFWPASVLAVAFALVFGTNAGSFIYFKF
jgi:alginate O-acetyltransferase complex protein AlgI